VRRVACGVRRAAWCVAHSGVARGGADGAQSLLDKTHSSQTYPCVACMRARGGVRRAGDVAACMVRMITIPLHRLTRPNRLAGPNDPAGHCGIIYRLYRPPDYTEPRTRRITSGASERYYLWQSPQIRTRVVRGDEAAA
jgi:hypothetical protein